MKPSTLVLLRFCGVLVLISCFQHLTLADDVTETSATDSKPADLHTYTAKDTIKVDKAIQVPETNQHYLSEDDTSQVDSYYDGDEQNEVLDKSVSNDYDWYCDKRRPFYDSRWKEMYYRLLEMYEKMNKRDPYDGQLDEGEGSALDRLEYYTPENLIDKRLDYYDRRLKPDGYNSPRSTRASNDGPPSGSGKSQKGKGQYGGDYSGSGSTGGSSTPTKHYGKWPPSTGYKPPAEGGHPHDSYKCACLKPTGSGQGSVNFNQWHPNFFKSTDSFTINNNNK